MAGLLAIFAEFEREILRERTRAGLAQARQNGKKLGRQMTAGLQGAEIRKLYRAGAAKAEIARRLHIGRTSVRRVLANDERITVAAKMNRALYQVKVTLRDIHPPIWRRIQVWEDITLAQFHRVLQIVMTWEDYHLHDFVIGRRTYSVPDPNDDLNERNVVDEKRIRLRDVITRVGTQFEYLYDFGDGWYHELLLEAIVLPEPALSYPRCLAGERRTPPEDVGGTTGYENYLGAMQDPDHEEHEHILQWRSPFDPESFSLSDVKKQLQNKFRSAKRTPPTSGAPSTILLQ